MPRGAAQASAPYDTMITAGQQPVSLTLSDVGQIIWRRLWIVFLVALVVVGTSVGATLVQTPVYQASAKLLVGQQQVSGDDQAVVNLAGTVEGLQQLTLTIVEAINTRSVAEETIQRLGLRIAPDELMGNLTAEQVADTQFVQVTYKDSDPERAQQIVNTVGEVTSERVSALSDKEGAYKITVEVWEDADVPNSPVSPNPVRNAILGLGLGLMLGMGLAFLAEYLDDSLRSPEELEQAAGVPTFGTIPQFRS